MTPERGLAHSTPIPATEGLAGYTNRIGHRLIPQRAICMSCPLDTAARTAASRSGLLLRCAALIVLAAAALFADEVELRNGSKLRGTVIRQTVDTVTIETAGQPSKVVTLSTDKVRVISIDGRRRVLKHSRIKKRPRGNVGRTRSGDGKSFEGLTSDEYQRKFDELAPKGYRPVDIRGYPVGDEARYDLTMEKRPRGKWFARHDCSHAKFLRENARAEAEGFTLVVHSQFRVGDKVLHAAVWEKMPLTFHQSDEIPETGSTAPELAPLDEMMRSFVREHDVPGVAVAIAKTGRLVYARGFGYADVEKKEPVQPDSLFRIASISKPITAVAVMQLVERGKLTLDTRVVDILKFRAPRGTKRDPRLKKVTVRHLLDHAAGWDRSKSFDPMFRSVQIAKTLHVPAPAKPEQIIRYMFGQPLDFEPGERSAYSNFGYCVLGRIIEKVSGQTYENYVLRNVLAPLGATRMRIGNTRPSGRAEGEVRYYTRYGDMGPSVFQSDLGKRVPVQYGAWCLEAMDSHGGWIASAIDLVRFASSLDDSARARVLSRESVRVMFAPPPEPIGRDARGKLKPVYYACGWRVRPIHDGRANTWHAGGFAGTSTLLVRRFDGFCWAVLFNTNESIDGKAPAGLIDGLMHRAVNKVRKWPRGRLLNE